MKQENIKLNIMDLKGLFCDWLSRSLNNGALVNEFVETMKKYGVALGGKEKETADKITRMIHSDADFSYFLCKLFLKRDTMNVREKLMQVFEEEETKKTFE